MANYIASPQTETEYSRMDNTQAHLDFSVEQSFQAPQGRDALFKELGGARQRPLSTPRAPLATLRNANVRSEFTPVLKSATTNRMRQVNGLLDGKLTTPAALRPGFQMTASPLPEATMMDAMNSSTISDSAMGGRSPVPEGISSSDMSTPMALPRRGQEGLEGNGNVLTDRKSVV